MRKEINAERHVEVKIEKTGKETHTVDEGSKTTETGRQGEKNVNSSEEKMGVLDKMSSKNVPCIIFKRERLITPLT